MATRIHGFDIAIAGCTGLGRGNLTGRRHFDADRLPPLGGPPARQRDPLDDHVDGMA
jgi:hypothetical protein